MGKRIKNHFITAFLILSLIFSVFVCVGCRSHIQMRKDVRKEFYANNLGVTADKILSEEERSKSDRNVLQMERVMVEMCRGNFSAAKSLLRGVRDRLDQQETEFHGAAKMASLLTDDLKTPYMGEDYEKVLIRVMLTLCGMMNDDQDVNAYANQINLKQEQIIQNALDPVTGKNSKTSYKNVALGAFLSGVIAESSMNHYDDAVRQYQKVVSWSPDFSAGPINLARAKTGHHSGKGNGVIHVFTFVGRGPYKEQVNADVTQSALLVADQIVSSVSHHTVPPTFAPVPIPQIVQPACVHHAVGVQVDGKPLGRTETILDVNRMAAAQFEVIRPEVIGRAVARRILKKASIYGIKEATDIKTGSGEFLLDVAGVVWEASEQADTRCWGLLPGRIQVARVELPAGVHRVGLQGVSSAGRPTSELYQEDVMIHDGRDTYVLAYFSDTGLLGNIQVSTQP